MSFIKVFLLAFVLAFSTQSFAFDINTATEEEIKQNMEGVGDKKAEAIVKYRKKHGSFKSSEDLLEVPGIGEATVNKNKDNLGLGKLKSSKGKEISKKKPKKEAKNMPHKNGKNKAEKIKNPKKTKELKDSSSKETKKYKKAKDKNTKKETKKKLKESKKQYKKESKDKKKQFKNSQS